MDATTPEPPSFRRPAWAQSLLGAARAGAFHQFILHGNVDDLFLSGAEGGDPQNLDNLICDDLLPGLATGGSDPAVAAYDLAHGLQWLRGNPPEHFQAAALSGAGESSLPSPAATMEVIDQWLNYHADALLPCGLILRDFELLPQDALPRVISFLRRWAVDRRLSEAHSAIFLVGRSLSDLPEHLVRNRRARVIHVDLPSSQEMSRAWTRLGLTGEPPPRLAGRTLASLRAPENLPLSARCFEWPDVTETFPGHDLVKKVLEESLTVWKDGHEAAVHQAVILAGPEGMALGELITGAAGAARVPMLPLRMFENPHQRESAWRDFEETLWQAQGAAQPAVLLLENADLVPGLGSAASGRHPFAAARVHGIMERFFAAQRQQSLLFPVFTAARPDRLTDLMLLTGGDFLGLAAFPTADAREGFQLLQYVVSQEMKLTLRDEAFAPMEDYIPWLLTPRLARHLSKMAARRHLGPAQMGLAEAFVEAGKRFVTPVDDLTLQEQMRAAIDLADDPEMIPDLLRNHFKAD